MAERKKRLCSNFSLYRHEIVVKALLSVCVGVERPVGTAAFRRAIIINISEKAHCASEVVAKANTLDVNMTGALFTLQ